MTDALPYYFALRRSSLPPAVGLLDDLLPADLLVGEVAAWLATVLLHAGRPDKLIYPSIRLCCAWLLKGPSRHPLFRWFRVITERTVTKLACGSNVEATSLL